MKQTIIFFIIAMLSCSGCERDSSKSVMDDFPIPQNAQVSSGVKVAVTAEQMKASEAPMAASSVSAVSGVESSDSSKKASLPPTLEMFLQQNPSFHLLNTSDLSDEYFKQALASHESEAYRLADTNRDGKVDVIAVVVKEYYFSVIVLHTISDGVSAKPIWLIRDSNTPIAGVFANKDYIVPAYCVGCDTNDAYAWTGSEYGKNVVPKGGSVCINSASNIYSSADGRSKIVYTTSKLENAKVLSVGLSDGEYYWHQIKLDSGQTGFVLNSTFNEDCQ